MIPRKVLKKDIIKKIQSQFDKNIFAVRSKLFQQTMIHKTHTSQ